MGGVHTLALLAATQAHAAALPAGVLAHPFDDKTAMVSAGEEHTLCVTSGGVVYAWGSNFQGHLGINNTTQQAQVMGVHMRRSTVPLRWSEHLCNGSPARMVACGDHHTLVLTQAEEVFACGRGGHGETGNSLFPDIVRVPKRCVWRLAGHAPEPARKPRRSGDGAGRALGVIYIYFYIYIYRALPALGYNDFRT